MTRTEPTILKQAYKEGYRNPYKACPYGDAWDEMNQNAPVAFQFEKGKLERLKEIEKTEKEELSKIFVKWGLPTRQVAINDILKWHNQELKRERERVLEEIAKIKGVGVKTIENCLSNLKEKEVK